VRKPIVGISYKTYINSIQKACMLARRLVDLTGKEKAVEQVIFPSIGTLYPVSQILQNSRIALGAQNISPEKNGPFTGELSIESVIEMGGKFVEIGHAERKAIFHETLEMINKKTRLTLDLGLLPFLCIGEEEKQNNAGSLYKILQSQILSSLKNIENGLVHRIVFAYEPVWAIGKSAAAEPEYVHSAHEIIRQIIKNLYGSEASDRVRIIYGGSVSKDNVLAIVKNENVDGVFIGRFGHEPDNYKEMVDTVKKIKAVENR